MARLEYDKYYTPPEIAERCVKRVAELRGAAISEAIEPAAGNGVFLDAVRRVTNWKVKGFDIEPERDDIIRQDFLELELPRNPKRLILGNPPFGHGKPLWREFLSHALTMADCVAFILPPGQLDKEFGNGTMLVYSEDLGSVKYSGKRLRCCFNIYRRLPNEFDPRQRFFHLNSPAKILRSKEKSDGTNLTPVLDVDILSTDFDFTLFQGFPATVELESIRTNDFEVLHHSNSAFAQIKIGEELATGMFALASRGGIAGKVESRYTKNYIISGKIPQVRYWFEEMHNRGKWHELFDLSRNGMSRGLTFWEINWAYVSWKWHNSISDEPIEAESPDLNQKQG